MKSLALIHAALANLARPAVNVLLVASAVKDGETITMGTRVYECDVQNPSGIVTGNIRVDCSAAASAAVATTTLTSTGTAIADGVQVVLGPNTYTGKTTLTGAANEVLIGSTADGSAFLSNLKKAVNLTGVAGVDYGLGTVIHPSMTATTLTSTTLVVNAKVKGTAGNSLATTENSATLSFTGATLASGADVSASDYTTALVAAINADLGNQVTPVRISAGEVLVSMDSNTATPLACSETLTGSGNVWAAATMYGANSIPANLRLPEYVQRVPNASEVSTGNLHVVLSQPPNGVIVHVRVTATGAKKQWDGAYTITGNRVTLDNSGSTDWAATDTVILEVF